jgi:3-hydroxyisobutyrate dehydrogenase
MARQIRFGFIGLGNMGAPMAQRLLDSGFTLVLWNRTVSKMEPLLEAGAKKAAEPAEVMRQADMVGLCLRDTAAVEAVALGPRGLLAGARGSTGKLVILLP